MTGSLEKGFELGSGVFSDGVGWAELGGGEGEREGGEGGCWMGRLGDGGS